MTTKSKVTHMTPKANHPADTEEGPHPERRIPEPLGPDSLVWKYFGDLRLLLVVTRTGLMLNMFPEVSRSLEQHSGKIFFRNPWNRILRSLPPIAGVIYDARPHGTGKTVRDYHANIKGTMRNGESYHALTPELFYATHNVFVDAIVASQEYFGTPLTEAEKEQLYHESIQWYAQYGVSMRPVPPDYESYKTYWAEVLAGLRATEVTNHTIALKHSPRPSRWIPKSVWWAVEPPLLRGALWLARGTMPPGPRAQLGWTWSRNDERLLRTLGWAVRHGFELLPEDWRYSSQARRARRGAAGSSTSAAALTPTPLH